MIERGLEVLVLHGAPGSGKSMLATTIADVLRHRKIPHAVIDIDELARVYPETHMKQLQWQNLVAILPQYRLYNYDSLKLVIPVLLESEDDMYALRTAVTPYDQLIVYELETSMEIACERVGKREPNEYWQQKMQAQVMAYYESDHITADRTIDTSISDPLADAEQMLSELGWLQQLTEELL